MSAADTDDDAVTDVTVMLTRESTGVAVVVAVAAAVLVLDLVELNVASSWRALLSSYEHVSRASSTTERLLSGNSSINLVLADRHTRK